MKLKRTTGLITSLALLMIPATAALAKPVASHHLDVIWSESSGGTFVNGGFDLTVDDSGVPVVDLLLTEIRPQACDGGLVGAWQSSLQFSGEAELKTVIDRQLGTIEVRGTLQAERTVTSPCGESVVTSEIIEFGLTGVSVDRPVRTRDRADGTRHISRAQHVVLDFGDVSVDSIAILTRTISRA